MVTLIFPASAPTAPEYLEAARRRGEPVVAASSVSDPQMEAEFGELVQLPYVHDEAFRERFCELARSRKVTQVYSTVASVYAFLEAFLAREKLPINLIGSSPIARQVESYRKLIAKAEDAKKFIDQCADARATISPLDIAAILRQSGNIYGESNEDKIMIMMAIFASAPKGDVIEIGSLLGRSAFVLQYLAQRYKTGSVLSVDPLTASDAVQHDSPAVVRDTLVDAWDYEIQRKAFAINLLPTGGGHFNYLRMDSERGFDVYRKQRTINSPEFGDVTYAGKIAVIHIDGNHDYKQVNKDCQLWLGSLAPGAWLILDDYLWAHGDGPHRVGDALLQDRWRDMERAFVCGKALFIKFT